MAIASTALETYKNDAKNMVVALVDMERAFVPPQHFIRLVQRRYVSQFCSFIGSNLTLNFENGGRKCIDNQILFNILFIYICSFVVQKVEENLLILNFSGFYIPFCLLLGFFCCTDFT